MTQKQLIQEQLQALENKKNPKYWVNNKRTELYTQEKARLEDELSWLEAAKAVLELKKSIQKSKNENIINYLGLC